MKKSFSFRVGLLFLLLFALSLPFASAHAVSSQKVSHLSYEQFRSDLVGRNYELDEQTLTEEFHFLQKLAGKYPSWSYHQLFAKYYSLHIFFLEDYKDENLF